LVILPADRAVTIQSNKLGSPFVYWTFQPAALFLGQDQLTLPFFFCWRANKGWSCFAKLSGGQKVPPAVGGGVGVGVGH